MSNFLSKNRAIVIFLFVLYLALSPTTLVVAGLMRFFPTLVLILVSIFGLISWGGVRNARMGLLFKFFVLFVIFNAIVTESAYDNKLITLVRSTYWIWVYFLSFVFFYNKKLCSKEYQRIIVLISILMMSVFYISHKFHVVMIEKEVRDNIIFYSLMLLPWISIIHNKKFKWIIIVLLSLCTLLSIKRSSAIIMMCSVIIIYYSDFLRNKKIKLSTIFAGFIVVICLVGISYFASDKVDVVVQRFELIEEAGGSGRDGIYEDVYNRYLSSSIVKQILGHGFDGVRRDSSYIIPVSAHNDFLEVLYDFGVIGFLLYVLIHFSLIKWSIQLFRARSRLAFPVLISYVCFLVMSIVSHLVLYPTYFGLLVAFWAYAECKDKGLQY